MYVVTPISLAMTVGVLIIAIRKLSPFQA